MTLINSLLARLRDERGLSELGIIVVAALVAVLIVVLFVV